MKSIAVCDLDDLWCEEQITQNLLPIKTFVPLFRVTCYSIPALLGPVHDLARKWPWITFAIHGHVHSFAECRAWTDEDAEYYIRNAIDMGYAPLFKPPNWICDPEIEEGCRRASVVLHHHLSYEPAVAGLRTFPGPTAQRSREYENPHSHIQRSPAVDFVAEHERFQPQYLGKFTEFKTPLDYAVEVLPR